MLFTQHCTGSITEMLHNQFSFLTQPYAKFLQHRALGWTLALMQPSLLLTFSTLTTRRPSEYQDKITDNKGLENSQTTGIEITIFYPCMDQRHLLHRE